MQVVIHRYDFNIEVTVQKCTSIALKSLCKILNIMHMFVIFFLFAWFKRWTFDVAYCIKIYSCNPQNVISKDSFKTATIINWTQLPT